MPNAARDTTGLRAELTWLANLANLSLAPLTLRVRGTKVESRE